MARFFKTLNNENEGKRKGSNVPVLLWQDGDILQLLTIGRVELEEKDESSLHLHIGGNQSIGNGSKQNENSEWRMIK